MGSTTANDVPIEGMAQMILGRDDERLAEAFVEGFHLGSDNGYARAREETFLAAAEAMDHRLQSEALPAAVADRICLISDVLVESSDSDASSIRSEDVFYDARSDISAFSDRAPEEEDLIDVWYDAHAYANSPYAHATAGHDADNHKTPADTARADDLLGDIHSVAADDVPVLSLGQDTIRAGNNTPGAADWTSPSASADVTPVANLIELNDTTTALATGQSTPRAVTGPDFSGPARLLYPPQLNYINNPRAWTDTVPEQGEHYHVRTPSMSTTTSIPTNGSNATFRGPGGPGNSYPSHVHDRNRDRGIFTPWTPSTTEHKHNIILQSITSSNVPPPTQFFGIPLPSTSGIVPPDPTQPAFASRQDKGVRPGYPFPGDIYSDNNIVGKEGKSKKLVADPWRVVIGPLSEVAMMDWRGDGGKGFWGEKFRAAAALAAGVSSGSGGFGQRGGRRGRGGGRGGYGHGRSGSGGWLDQGSVVGSQSGGEAGWGSQESGTGNATARSGLVFCHLVPVEKEHGDGHSGGQETWYITATFESQAKASAALKFFEGGYPCGGSIMWAWALMEEDQD
ncbi:uncharacterized protein C8A04DRAFT_31917 [Dichotomopilus funicola]|uniref:Uncharacterized protein n=1 Tax=Dichotomopilus funicola TaxID=1934379 RepID=A0AAN6UZ56_9PEZI|nr:hypothetical protein C8A04DRAFT_31917 [Dichotomopilus funicola]